MTGEKPIRLVIVGGVAGGMSAAARARRLSEDAEIIVLDRGEHVSFANCGLPYFVGGEIEDAESLLVQTPERLRASLDLDVRTRHDVVGLDTTARQLTVMTDSGIETLEYDRLILSPGARPLRPPLPGIDSPRVHTVRSVPDAIAIRNLVEHGARRAVVLGAGFIGVEMAEALVGQGLEVTLVEMAEHVLPLLEPEMAAPVSNELARLGVSVVAGTAAGSIIHCDDHDTVVLSDGQTVDTDLVILSVGVRPDTAVFEEAGIHCERGAIVVDDQGRTSAPDVWAVGDATLSRDAVTGALRPIQLAGPANRAGRLVADNIFGEPRTVPAALGTAIVRVGELTAAMTGANRSSLELSGTAYHSIHLHPNHHAGYFPGAETIHLMVLFAADGRLLGAQAVGRGGVDKRIDVLATAIRAGMSVVDLIDLDLAYSPPYGNAKDPINLAGMMGENVLSGRLVQWHAEDLDDVMANRLLVDTRSRGEFRRGHVAGAVNFPNTEIRESIEEVRTLAGERPVALICASGVRSYLAHRVLAQHGIDSASLSGGMITLDAALGPRCDDMMVVPVQ